MDALGDFLSIASSRVRARTGVRHHRGSGLAVVAGSAVVALLAICGLAVWSADPPVGPGGRSLLADLAAETTAAADVVPVLDTGPGVPAPATVASFTVTYGGENTFTGVTDALVDGSAANLGTIPAWNDAVDTLHKPDGSYARILGH